MRGKLFLADVVVSQPSLNEELLVADSLRPRCKPFADEGEKAGPEDHDKDSKVDGLRWENVRSTKRSGSDTAALTQQCGRYIDRHDPAGRAKDSCGDGYGYNEDCGDGYYEVQSGIDNVGIAQTMALNLWEKGQFVTQ